jgi:hypothetical protein
LTCFMVVPPCKSEMRWTFANGGKKGSIGFPFIEKFRDGHLFVATGAARQVFDRQVNNLRVAAFRTNHFDRLAFATFHVESL